MERVPSRYFKTLVAYVDTIEPAAARQRIAEEACELLGDHSKIPFEALESRLIEETNDVKARAELKQKILMAKVKRIEKIAEKKTFSE